MTTVRPEADGEQPAIRTVIASAFGDECVADLADALRAGPARASLVAVLDEQIVGHVMLSRGWVDARERLAEVLILSPLAVAPLHQGRGVGGALARAAISAAGELAAPLVFLEGSPEFYPRFGFLPAASCGFGPPSVRIPDSAFQVVTLPSWQPWMTGAVVYPDAFWMFDRVGLRA